MSIDRDDLPFQTVVPDPAPAMAWESEAETADPEWSLAALEEAYQRALESADAVTEQIELENSPASEPDASGSVQHAPPASVPDSHAPALPCRVIAPEQVLEALLFVGGEPLTARRAADLLGGTLAAGQIDDMVETLNTRYNDQCRPYQVLPGEGGYRLALRPDFEPIRSRVYGLGPRDVRLSQDALEILAFIAYQQPVERSLLEATGKSNVAAIVRQLLRLELVSLERGNGGKDDIHYRTTARFLTLFALDRLEELPHPEDLMFK